MGLIGFRWEETLVRSFLCSGAQCETAVMMMMVMMTRLPVIVSPHRPKGYSPCVYVFMSDCQQHKSEVLDKYGFHFHLENWTRIKGLDFGVDPHRWIQEGLIGLLLQQHDWNHCDWHHSGVLESCSLNDNPYSGPYSGIIFLTSKSALAWLGWLLAAILNWVGWESM